MESKQLINLFGQSCTGKSSVTDIIKVELSGLYTLDWDVVKRQLSHYYWKNDREIVVKIALGFLETLCKENLPTLVLLPPAANEAEYDKWMRYAQAHGYRITNIELTAPRDVLTERYAQRLKQIEPSGTSIKLKTPQEFAEKLDKQYFVADETISFDSSLLTSKVIADEILAKIWRGDIAPLCSAPPLARKRK